MVKVTGKRTTTYSVGNGFYVDVCKTDEIYDSWIYHGHIGIKSYMFGTIGGTMKGFMKWVRSNIDEYVESYKEEYMNEEE